MQLSLRKGTGWTIDSVTDHTINISKYNPLTGSNYIKLPKALDHPRKGLINIDNIVDVWNCVYLEIYILYLKIQQEVEKLTINLTENLILKVQISCQDWRYSQSWEMGKKMYQD